VRDQSFEQFCGDLLGDDHHAGRIRDDQIARVHHHAAAADRVIDLSGAAMKRPNRRSPAREDREIELLNRRQVAHQPVDHKTRDAAMLSLGRDQIAEDGIHVRPARVNHDYVAGLRNIQRLVHHQVVAGKALDRAGGAAELVMNGGQQANLRIHRIEPIEQV
jgi:hypothetical protein